MVPLHVVSASDYSMYGRSRLETKTNQKKTQKHQIGIRPCANIAILSGIAAAIWLCWVSITHHQHVAAAWQPIVADAWIKQRRDIVVKAKYAFSDHGPPSGIAGRASAIGCYVISGNHDIVGN